MTNRFAVSPVVAVIFFASAFFYAATRLFVAGVQDQPWQSVYWAMLGLSLVALIRFAYKRVASAAQQKTSNAAFGWRGWLLAGVSVFWLASGIGTLWSNS
jgi:membrane protease YdiL (CAAX protease family)